MSTFVVTKKRQAGGSQPSPDASPPVRGEPIPAIFTDLRAAGGYLRNLGGEYEIARLSAMQLLQWMIRVYEQGVHYLEVNPSRLTRFDDNQSGCLAIEKQLAHFAELLTRDIVACAESARQARQETG